MVNYCYNRTTVIDMNDIKVNLTEIYLNHPGAFEEWLVSDGNDDLIKRITDIKLKQKKQEGNGGEGGGSSPSIVNDDDDDDDDDNDTKKNNDIEKDIGDDGRTRRKKIERNNSVTSELFQVWVSSSSPKKLKSQNG